MRGGYALQIPPTQYGLTSMSIPTERKPAMSRSKKDKPGGHAKDTMKYPLYGMVPSKLKRHKRRATRAKSKHDLRNLLEPQPLYAPQRNYFD